MYSSAAGLVALTVLSYVRFVSVGFVATDSLPLVETSRITNLADLVALFTRPVMADTSFFEGELVYRPFVSLTFGLDYAVWGTNAVGYHLTNLVLHAVGALLVWQLLTVLGLRWWSAFIGAAIFALHPLGVASIPVIARRDSILPVTAFVAALILILAAERASGVRQALARVASLVLAGIALFSKESAFAAVGLLPLALVLEARAHGSDWRGAISRWRLAIPCLLIAALVFGLRLEALGSLGGTGDSSYAIGSAPQILGAYMRNVLWSFAWIAPSTHVIWLIVAGLLVIALGGGIAALPRPHAALGAMGLAWVVGFALFSLVFRVATVGWLVYFALPGVAILCAAGLEGGVARLRERRSASWFASGLLLVALGAMGATWVVTSPLLRSYAQWQTAGDVSRRYLDALNGCVATSPNVSHVRLEGMPSLLDDGRPETEQMGVTLFEDHTIESALRLLFPERSLTFTVWSREAVRSDQTSMRFECSSDSERVVLTALYS